MFTTRDDQRFPLPPGMFESGEHYWKVVNFDHGPLFFMVSLTIKNAETGERYSRCFFFATSSYLLHCLTIPESVIDSIDLFVVDSDNGSSFNSHRIAHIDAGTVPDELNEGMEHDVLRLETDLSETIHVVNDLVKTDPPNVKMKTVY